MLQTQSLPEGAEPLSEPGFFSHATVLPYGIGFSMFIQKRDTEEYVRFEVCDVRKPLHEPNIWHRRESDWRHRVQPHSPPSTLGAKAARCYAEIMVKAADLVEKSDVHLEPAIARAKEAIAERERQAAARQAEFEEQARKRREERRLEEQKEEERCARLYEIVRWLLDERFRLRRYGKKSTVFGTIDAVSEPRELNYGTREEPDVRLSHRGIFMSITTEKNVAMTIDLRDVCWMEVRDEDSRNYSNIFDETNEEAKA